MKKILLWCWLFVVVSAPVSALNSPAPVLTGRDVMQMVQKENQKKTTRKATVHMTITDKKNKERVRYFTYVTKYNPKITRHLITFFQPKPVKGTALLSETDHASGKKSQWVYLPAFKSIKRLTSSDKNKSFMGSDFSYSDIAGRKLDDDTHRLVKETDAHFFIESIPKDASNATYSKIRYVISKAHRLVITASFYGANGKKLKTFSNSKVSIINDVNVVMHSEMVNHLTNGQTVLTVQSMDVGGDIRDDVLSIKGLKAR